MASLIDIQQKYLKLGIGNLPAEAITRATYRAGYIPGPHSESGMRTTPENAIKYMQMRMGVDYELRSKILDIRHMDQADGRVKKIHARMARAAIKGGLKLENETSKKIQSRWREFVRRLELHRREKLESDARGLVMEGNLPLQWVLDAENRVAAGIRMPTETIRPVVSEAGVFTDPRRAYEQYDLMGGRVVAAFALFQLTLARLTPDNYDDKGSLGRPYLDAARSVWQKLTMTEEDLVIRRKTRAPQRKVHQLESADDAYFEKYKSEVDADKWDQSTDYVIKGKGDVKALQGDANLDQIADVAHLLDTFFAGSPAPKGLFGYVGDLSRDVLEDLKRDFYDELDSLQDTLAYLYEFGFKLDLMLTGINPDNFDFRVVFAERRTETPNQAADRALKYQALGAAKETVLETAGLDAARERNRLEREALENDPYPDPTGIDQESANRRPRVAVTPSNARKGESATTISTRN